MANITKPDETQYNKKLADSFYRNSQYGAHILGLAGIGFIVIYLLGQFGLLGNKAPQFLVVGIAVILLSLLQFPVRALAKRGDGVTAVFTETFLLSIFAILLVSLSEGASLIGILIVILIPIGAISSGLSFRHTLLLLGLTFAGIVGVIYANEYPFIFSERLKTNTPAALASLTFLTATGILLIATILISGNRNYRNLRSQYLLSSIVIVTVPTIMATVLSAIGGYVNNETQALDTLETVANLKINQLEDLITVFENDMYLIQSDVTFRTNILTALVPDSNTSVENNRSIAFARSRLLTLQRLKDDPYEEIMVLDIKGKVIVSTNSGNEGISYQSEQFYRQGSLGSYIGFSDSAIHGDSNLFIASPIYDSSNTVLRGTLVIRANSQLIKNIIEKTPGYEEAETYLLDRNLHPLTQLRTPADIVRTTASLSATLNNATNNRSTYENYTGEVVLGYYRWFAPLNVIFIAELPRSIVIGNSIGALAASSSLALLSILIAIVAVAITVNFTVQPISSLVKTTEEFASGNLAARSKLDRADEIGTLGSAYNQMAEQLQNIIGKLEQRVSDRTRELEDQTVRLRVAAEIAKDAASARNVTELLERSGQLIQNRFGFYHTGIFFIDSNKEYAVLTASPTEAGKKMIAIGHKLRIGEVGIVGKVAATGEPRITLDTGLDAVHFNNPYLPNTHSEMALPLKVENNIIGVLDVQSDQPQAFTQEDAAIMQVLADQLATAIERTRLLQQVEESLKELEKAYGRITQESWKSLVEKNLISNFGYRFDNVRIQPINEGVISETEVKAMSSGNIMPLGDDEKGTGERVAIPIKLRGQPIGVVSVKLKEESNPATIGMLEQVIERLAGSLESARLFEEARLRADREQALSQVTSSISSATDFDTILRTTVEELGKTLGDSEVSIQIVTEEE